MINEFELKLDRSIHSAVIPWRYLKGVSGGDMCEALKVLFVFEYNGFFTRSGVAIEAVMGARAPAVDVELFG